MQSPFDRDCQGLRGCAYEFHVVRNRRGNSGSECAPVHRRTGSFDSERQDRQGLLGIQEKVAGDHDIMQPVVHYRKFDRHELAAGDLVDASPSF
jgi:hypothetical protein